MVLLIGFFGFIVGLFLWSNIFGSFFGTLPVERKMVAAGVIPKIGWTKIIGTVVFAAIILALTALFARSFFYGTLVSGVIMSANIGKLKGEAMQNFNEELERKRK